MRFGPGDDAGAEGWLYRLLMALALIRRAGFGQALALDAAIVVALAGVTEWRVWVAHGGVAGPKWLTTGLPLLLDLPLLWRRRLPLLAVALVMAAMATQALVSGDAAEGFFLVGPTAVGLYSLGAYGGRRQAVLGLAITAAAATAHDLEDPQIASGTHLATATLFWWLLLLAVWLVGVFVGSRREAAALAARASRLERDAQVAVAEERARMARELHDIVSHNLSVVVAQAAGARAVAERRPGAVSPTLEKIERSGRAALVEMRRLLGVLREDAGDANLAPQPGLTQLEALAASVRAAGLAVELEVEGDFGDLPPAVDLSAYRIIQEALTNALKHAGPARAHVYVRRDPDALVIEVVDDGAGTGDPPEVGHGLVGMRERVAVFGGEFRARARREGGFAVQARLPLTGDRA